MFVAGTEPTLSSDICDFHIFFLIFLHFCTNSFARSFASSSSITGTSLAISHNQVRNLHGNLAQHHYRLCLYFFRARRSTLVIFLV